MAPKHNEDFKREAVRIATHSGLTRRQVASDLGVGFSTLGKWMRDYSTDPAAAEDAELRRENERLRKENRRSSTNSSLTYRLNKWSYKNSRSLSNLSDNNLFSF